MRKTLLILSILFFLSSDTSAQETKTTNPVKKMMWLVGSWQGTYNSRSFYEAWRPMNDSALINFTIEIIDADTIVKENAVVRYIKNELRYKSKNAEWKLAQLSDSSMEFRNDTIRFANVITWTRSADDHWLTVIKNSETSIKYDLIRVDWLDRLVDKYVAGVKSGNK